MGCQLDEETNTALKTARVRWEEIAVFWEVALCL